MAPNAAPGLFLGWRMESGMRYLGAVKVIDYDAVRSKGFDPRCFKVVDQKEVHFPEECVFPFLEARKTSLRQMKDIDLINQEPPVAAALPWEDHGVDGGSAGAASSSDKPAANKSADAPQLAKPPIPFFRITWDRCLQYKSPGCKACEKQIISGKQHNHPE